MTNALKSESIKTPQLRLLAKGWCRNEYGAMLKTNELYFGLDQKVSEYGQKIPQSHTADRPTTS